MITTDSPQLRWSSTRDCPRKAVFEATGAPHRERTLREERQLARGRSVGRDYLVALASENRKTIWAASGPFNWIPPSLRAASEDAADIIAERQVRWELGVGHADAVIKETDTVLEVLSSQHASAEMIHSKLLQACGYALNLRAQNIALVVVDPATLEDERLIVTRTSDQWDGLVREVDERVRQVLSWHSGDGIPARVCAKPSEARGHFCDYAEHCFEGHEPAPLDELNDPDTHELVARLYHAKAKEREVKQTLALVETERKEIQQRLEDRVEPGKFQVGAFQINRSPRRKETFKLALAKEDSRLERSLIEEFTNVSTYDIWSVERNGNAEVDYGEVAF